MVSKGNRQASVKGCRKAKGELTLALDSDSRGAPVRNPKEHAIPVFGHTLYVPIDPQISFGGLLLKRQTKLVGPQTKW